MADPVIGENRTANGETRTWDGSAWRLSGDGPRPISADEPTTYSDGAIKGLKDYATELLQGTGTARGQVADYGKREGSAFLSTLNPINQVKGLIHTVMHPIETAQGVGDLGSGLLSGQPEAVGTALGLAVMPKANAAMLRGVNTGATTLATSPSARSATGYVGGYLGAKVAGEPGFAGAILGRAASPLLQYPAADIAKGSGWLIDKLGLSDSPTQVNGLNIADLRKAGVGDNAINATLKGRTIQPPSTPPSGLALTPIASRPTPTVVDALTQETPEAWRARVAAQIEARNAGQSPSGAERRGVDARTALSEGPSDARMAELQRKFGGTQTQPEPQQTDALQGRRRNIGADKLAQELRTQLGPAGGEAVGAPREVAPDAAANRMMQDMLNLPPGEARRAWMLRGTSEKVRGQTETMTRFADLVRHARETMTPEDFAKFIKTFSVVGAIAPAVMHRQAMLSGLENE